MLRAVLLLVCMLAAAAQPLPQPSKAAVDETLAALRAAARAPAPAAAHPAKHTPSTTSPAGGETAPGAESSRVASRDADPVVVLALGDRPVAPGKPVFEGDASAVAQRVVTAAAPAAAAPRASPAAAAAAAGADVDCGACADLCSAAGLRAAAPGGTAPTTTAAPRPRRALAGVETKSAPARADGAQAGPALSNGDAVVKATRCGCTCVGA